MSQRRKGKRGEAELARELQRWVDEEGEPVRARRSSQHRGAPDAPDLITSLPYAIEVKRRASFAQLSARSALEDWMAQAEKEAGYLNAVVIWRKDRSPWIVMSRGDHGELVFRYLDAWLRGLGCRRVTDPA